MAGREVDTLLQAGIAAVRAGRTKQARELLLQVIALDEQVEAAWLWLSGVVDDPEERQICLENVLALNPANAAAQAGLRWLKDQGLPAEPVPPAAKASPPSTGADLQADPAFVPAPVVGFATGPRSPESKDCPAHRTEIEIDPFGCPFCGGSIEGERSICLNCGRSAALRYRKSERGTGLVWLVGFFLVLGLASWLEGYAVYQLVAMGQLPKLLTETPLRLLVGAALLDLGGVPDHPADFATVLALSDYVLAGLCGTAALGLALRSRLAYLGSFLLAGLLAVVTLTGLATGLLAWLPALFRLVLVAVSLRWLVDSATAFEWQTRLYNADIEPDLRTDMDYYTAGQRYREMGMWAKAASHWKIASQLAPSQSPYRIALSTAYLRLGYPEAARAEVHKALDRAPDDPELRTFYESLARWVAPEGGEGRP